MSKDKKMVEICELKWRDMSLYSDMANAQLWLRKAARGLRADKAQSPHWTKHAEQAEGAIRVLGTWMDGLREEAHENKENGK